MRRLLRLRETEQGREKLRQQKRRAREKLVARGLTTNGTPRKRSDKSQALIAAQRSCVQARQHLRKWLKSNGPASCVLAWYAASGKPWNNPRLSSSERWKVKYSADEVFRAKEVLKAQQRKASRAKRVMETCDGTVTPQSLGALFASTSHCTYCGVQMNSVDKTADHVVPLCRDGTHTLDNLVVCCKTCNFSKGRKLVEEWLIENLPNSSYQGLISNRLRYYLASRPDRCVTGSTLREMATEPTMRLLLSSGSLRSHRLTRSSTTNANA